MSQTHLIHENLEHREIKLLAQDCMASDKTDNSDITNSSLGVRVGTNHWSQSLNFSMVLGLVSFFNLFILFYVH